MTAVWILIMILLAPALDVGDLFSFEMMTMLIDTRGNNSR